MIKMNAMEWFARDFDHPLYFDIYRDKELEAENEGPALVSLLGLPPASRVLDLLAALSLKTNFAVGCYCADEARCHRSVLRELLLERGAQVA